MANIARTSERLRGLFAYFVEEGTTVDAVTVSATAMPDADPTSNWLSFGTVLPGARFETETESDPYNELQSGGGFLKRNRERTVADYLVFQTREMNEHADRLELGVSGAIAEDTATTIFATFDRKITGWLLLQARQLGGNGDGTDDFRLNYWCELRLANNPIYENKAALPEFRAQRLYAAGNSGYWPAAS